MSIGVTVSGVTQPLLTPALGSEGVRDLRVSCASRAHESPRANWKMPIYRHFYEADERTRTADPFITSHARGVNARLRQAARGHD